MKTKIHDQISPNHNNTFAIALDQGPLDAATATTVVEDISRQVAGLSHILVTAETRVRNKGNVTIAYVGANAVSVALILSDEYGVPEVEQAADALNALAASAYHIAKVQDTDRIHEHSVPLDTDTSVGIVRKAVMLAGQRPSPATNIGPCIDSYLELIHASNTLISSIAEHSPAFSTDTKTNKLLLESIRLLDEFSTNPSQ